MSDHLHRSLGRAHVARHIGLLFIVVTLRSNRIVEREDHNTQTTLKATQFNTVHLLIALIVAVIVLMPQPLDTASWAAFVDRPDWGLPLIAISYTIILVRAVLNAWTLMFGVSSSISSK